MISQPMMNVKTRPCLANQACCFQRNSRMHGASMSQIRTSEASCRLQRRRLSKPLQISMAASESGTSAIHTALKPGYAKYETLMLITPKLSDEERDKELAKFEAFLSKEMASNIRASIRGRHRLAYPILGHTDGVYVLYTYTSPHSLIQKVQIYLSKPEVGSEGHIIRHMTSKMP